MLLLLLLGTLREAGGEGTKERTAHESAPAGKQEWG